MAFQAINIAKRIMETAQSPAAILAASRIAGDLAYKGHAMGWGTVPKAEMTPKSQEDLPRWEELPDEVRQAIDSWLERGSDAR